MKSLKKGFSFYDKNIDYYSASLSFFTIFAFVPMFIIALYVFSLLGLIDKLHFYLLDTVNILFPNYGFAKAYLDNFFAFDVSIGVVGAIYIVLVSYLFVRDYKEVVCNILDIQMNYTQSIIFYFKNTIILPLLISLYFSMYKFFSFDFFYNSFIFALFFFAYFCAIPTFASAKQNLFVIAKVSIIISLLWWAIKYIYIYYTLYNKAYFTLYGSLSAIFFLILWLYISWIIYLYGLKYYKSHSNTTL